MNNIDEIKEAIEIVRKGRYEVTWYKEKADEYNNALNLLQDTAQAYIELVEKMEKVGKMLPKKIDLLQKYTCENCIHENDSGTEYCGVCDSVVSNWSPNEEVQKARAFNQVISDCTLAITAKLEGLEEVISLIIFKKCQLSYEDAGKKVASAIREEMLR